MSLLRYAGKTLKLLKLIHVELMIRIANLISIFFILLFSCLSWGLVVTPKDIYRYYESQAAIDRSNYDYGAVVKLSGDVVRQTIGALADKAQEGSFYVIGSLHLTSLPPASE